MWNYRTIKMDDSIGMNCPFPGKQNTIMAKTALRKNRIFIKQINNSKRISFYTFAIS